MKVVETKSLYFGYDIDKPGDPVPKEVKWVSAYIIKQIIRMIQIKMLKDVMHDSDFWTPDVILQKLYGNRRKPNNNPKNNNSKNNASKRKKGRP